MLSRFKIRTDIAHNGKEAYETVKKYPGKYKLIFMDYDMPIMDGCQSIQLIRENEILNKLTKSYIVGCTAFVGEEL